MKNRFFILISLLLASMGACQPHLPIMDNSGLIVYQTLDEKGVIKPELAVMDINGYGLRLIPLPDTVYTYYPIRASGRLLLKTRAGKIVLVNTQAGLATELDIPITDAELLFEPPQYLMSDDGHWVILGNSNLAYLIDTHNGLSFDLRQIGLASSVFFSRFSPDGSYIATIQYPEPLLIPTRSPSQLRIIFHDGWIIHIDFSSDSQKIVYHDTWKVKIENIDGSGSKVVFDTEKSLYDVRFVPGKNTLVIADEDRLFLLDLNDGKQTQLLAYQDYTPYHIPELYFFMEDKLFYGLSTGETFQYYLSDITKGTTQKLDELESYFLLNYIDIQYMHSSFQWLTFVDLKNVGIKHRFICFNLKSGITQEIAGLIDIVEIGWNTLLFSKDGKYTLISTFPQEKIYNSPNQLWLLNCEDGTARKLAEAAYGILTPNGEYVLVNIIQRKDDRDRANLVLMTNKGDQIRSLGEGYYMPVWVYP